MYAHGGLGFEGTVARLCVRKGQGGEEERKSEIRTGRESGRERKGIARGRDGRTEGRRDRASKRAQDKKGKGGGWGGTGKLVHKLRPVQQALHTNTPQVSRGASNPVVAQLAGFKFPGRV